LMLIKACQFTLAAFTLWLIRTRRVPRNLVAFAVCMSAIFAFCATAAGITRGTANGTALLFIGLASATAIGLPWGVWAQASFVGVCALLVIWNDLAISGGMSPAVAGPATAAMVTAGLVSVFVAHGVERFRWQLEERELGLRLGQAHFRSLIEHGGDLIVVVSHDGAIQYVSPSV